MDIFTETFCEYADIVEVEDHFNLQKEFNQQDYRDIKYLLSFSTSNGAGVTKPELEGAQVSYNWEDKIILIAEDEETNYLFLKAALSKTNVAIIHAKNGQEAVDAVKSNPEIDVVLMDIKMPVMNGIDATRIIRTINEKMIVIAQTAYISESDRVTYLNAGCNDFLAKPITRDRLLRTISLYL